MESNSDGCLSAALAPKGGVWESPYCTHIHFLLTSPACLSWIPGPLSLVEFSEWEALTGVCRVDWEKDQGIVSLGSLPVGLWALYSTQGHSSSPTAQLSLSPGTPSLLLSLQDVWPAWSIIAVPGVLHHPLLVSLNFTFIVIPLTLSNHPFWTFHLFLANTLPDTSMDQNFA